MSHVGGGDDSGPTLTLREPTIVLERGRPLALESERTPSVLVVDDGSGMRAKTRPASPTMRAAL